MARRRLVSTASPKLATAGGDSDLTHGGNAYVQKHQDPLQLRTARDRRRDSCGVAAIREKSERLQQTIESERSRIPCGRRRDSRSFQEPSELARDECSAEEP